MELNAGLLSVFISLFITGFSAAMFSVIKFNDLVHLGKDMREIKKEVYETRIQVGSLAERISKLEGVCSVALRRAEKKKKK